MAVVVLACFLIAYMVREIPVVSRVLQPAIPRTDTRTDWLGPR